MNGSTKTAFVVAFVAAAMLLLLFGGPPSTVPMMGDGPISSVGMIGFARIWPAAVLAVVLVVVLVSLILRSRQGRPPG